MLVKRFSYQCVYPVIHPGQFLERAQDPGRLFRKQSFPRKHVSLASRRFKAQRQHNKGQTVQEHHCRVRRLLQREKRKREKLSNMGIDYDFPGYATSAKNSDQAKIPTHILFNPE